jgi:hypothetical protein
MRRVSLFMVQLLILALPFNGLVPLLDVGELSSEGFFYASLVYAPIGVLFLLAGKKLPFGAVKELFRSQCVYILLIVISLGLCFSTIQQNSYGSRTGLERYFLSAATYLYYFALTVVLCMHAGVVGTQRFLRSVAKAFSFLGLFLVSFGVVEIVSWFAEPVKEVLTSFRSVFALLPERPSYRLSGVSLEPSFNAFALLACIPWALFLAQASGLKRYRVLAAALLAISVASGARTAYLGLALMGFAYLLVRGVLRRSLPKGVDGALFVAVCFLLGVALPPIALSMVDVDSSVSNITRSYLMSGSVRAGLADLQGQGFGQVGFYVVQHVSSAVRYSWELVDFYEGDRYGELPPLFSWYARTFGEFGAFGYALIAASFSLFAKRLFSLGHLAGGAARPMFYVSALLLAQFLAIAFSIESVRVPQFWLAWLLAGLLTVQIKRGRTPDGQEKWK